MHRFIALIVAFTWSGLTVRQTVVAYTQPAFQSLAADAFLVC